ncbi:MAG: glycosyl transferase, partial [Campylobacteraceae bacterium]|nr:glycosyl transferase [Campylobacteraceae bacterium]
KIEKQIHFHQNNKDILVSHTDELWVRNNKVIKQKHHQKKPSGFCFEENIPACKIGPSTTILHKSILNDVGYFDDKLIVCEDYDLWLRISLKYEFGYLDEKLITKYAGHGNQLSFTTFAIDKYRIQALEKHLNGKFQIQIKDEIRKKCMVLLKGALKHNNTEIINVYEKKLEALDNSTSE